MAETFCSTFVSIKISLRIFYIPCTVCSEDLSLKMLLWERDVSLVTLCKFESEIRIDIAEYLISEM